MNYTLKLTLKIFLVWIAYSYQFFAAPFLDGTSTLVYKTTNQVFRAAGGSQSKVQGFVQLGNGFTILSDASAIFDTFLTVSGPIDLRETGTLILNADLKLSANVTFSSGGSIQGYGNKVALAGNLTIPAGKILHISGNAIIDGRGHALNVSDYGQIFVDTSTTLTLQNVILRSGAKTSVFGPIRCAGSTSQLVLDNVVIEPQGDFPWYHGKLFIYDTVLFTGTSSFIYMSPTYMQITRNASLIFDKMTTLSFAAASNSKDLLFFQDTSSKIVFDGASLKCTDTGLRLSLGTMICNNKCLFDTISGYSMSSVTTVTGGIYSSVSNTPGGCRWSSRGKYFAACGDNSTVIRVYSFDPTAAAFANICTTAFLTAYPYGMDWSLDGRYVAVSGPTGGNLGVYFFNGVSLTQVASYNTMSSWGNCVAWSPNGKYIAVGNLAVLSLNDLQVFQFNGTNLSLITTVNNTNEIDYLAWHPSGTYLAAAGAGNNSTTIYSFNGTGLTSIASQSSTTPRGVDWSPSGLFLAVGGGDNVVTVYSFANLTSLYSVASRGVTSSGIWCVKWSPDGTKIAIGGGNSLLRIFSFNCVNPNFTLTPHLDITVADLSNIRDISWHPNGKYLSILGNVAGGSVKKVYVVGVNYVGQMNQSIANSLVFNSYVTRAWYGDPNNILRRFDVLSYVNNNIRQNNGAINITANNAAFGDPASGTVKQLYITFANGTSVSCNENGSINVSASQVPLWQNMNLKILSGARVEIRGKVLDDTL